MFPVAVVVLSAFWLLSGVIGLLRLDAAATLLSDRLPQPAAVGAVVVGAFADLAIGIAFAFRRTVRPAAFAAVGVSAGYLAGATLLVPSLWADPLGPLVKVVPAMVLALAVAAMAEER